MDQHGAESGKHVVLIIIIIGSIFDQSFKTAQLTSSMQDYFVLDVKNDAKTHGDRH